MDEKISIYVAAHKPFVLPRHVDRDIFVPILCGKVFYNPDDYEIQEGQILPELGDDTGDNISAKNKHYSELTAMYWAWKNDKDSDIIGLNHYRRYFLCNTLVDFIDRETILSNLEKYDCMVLGPSSDSQMWYNEDFSVYMGYKGDHNIRDLDNALIACKNLFPEIYNELYKEVKTSTGLCMCNIILCRRELFDKYCSFLFPVLFEVEKSIDFEKDYDSDYQRRSLGFLSERLMRPWLVANRYTFKDQKICSFGD